MLYDHELQGIHELADVRQERLLQANAGLPAILWAVLLIGGVIVVAFTYLFGLQSTLVHTLMVAALALTIALVLFTVAPSITRSGATYGFAPTPSSRFLTGSRRAPSATSDATGCPNSR